MMTKELDHKLLTPIDVTVEEADNELIIRMPLLPHDTRSEKMWVLATTNGWLKTQILCPRTGDQIQVNIFVGTRM